MSEAKIAQRIRIDGRVQGVGFRPFVCRLARRLSLQGWVRNINGEVDIHVEGPPAGLSAFVAALVGEAPPLARPESPVTTEASLGGYSGFTIEKSSTGESGRIVIAPDHFVCADCLDEMRDRQARRYRYPFTNCTQCGPRYTIIDSLPYDRINTAMAGFEMCDDCRAEYNDECDRRYHAQPLACPQCGPELEFRDADGNITTGNAEALNACVAALKAGMIVAVKGIGGYHLMCDARSDDAVRQLRKRKHRPVKPFAVLVPEHLFRDQGALSLIAAPDELESDCLQTPLRPIVLTRKAVPTVLSEYVAPGLGEVGLMLPYSPLHHLLAEDFGQPMIATSANISGEPVLTDAEDVERKLSTVADAFLHHNRPIRRPADDSVFRRIGGSMRPLRLGRGLAPCELRLRVPVTCPTLAVGADQKNTIALAIGDHALVSPHLGDLSSPRSLDVFARTIDDLCRLFGVEPEEIVCDAHPGYLSSQWAQKHGARITRVLHHHAHASALWGESSGDAPALMFTWDGTGMGAYGTLMGGEAFVGQPGDWKRIASLKTFRLIGGDKASRDPWRCALAACLEAGIDWPDAPESRELAQTVWTHRINCPETSSAGRLFDAAAALAGIVQNQSHEAEAAMALEALATASPTAITLDLQAVDGIWVGHWAPLLTLMMDTRQSLNARASIFHASLAGLIANQAKQVRESHGIRRVGLTGGVFQNRVLAELAHAALSADGFEVFLPERLPANDGAISFGQIVEAAARHQSAPSDK